MRTSNFGVGGRDWDEGVEGKVEHIAFILARLTVLPGPMAEGRRQREDRTRCGSGGGGRDALSHILRL